MYKKRTIATVIGALLGAFALSASAAPIVTNGSFESGLTGWSQSGSGTTPGIGITVISTNVANGTGYGDNVPNYDGTHAAYFVDDNANEDLFQSVSLTSGTGYLLTFALFATNSGAANQWGFSLTDAIGANVLSSFTNATPNPTDVPVGVWTPYGYSFSVASTGNYNLDFHFIAGPTPAKDAVLDKVVIDATSRVVPEPATLVLLSVALVAFGAASLRRVDLRRGRASQT